MSFEFAYFAVKTAACRYAHDVASAPQPEPVLRTTVLPPAASAISPNRPPAVGFSLLSSTCENPKTGPFFSTVPTDLQVNLVVRTGPGTFRAFSRRPALRRLSICLTRPLRYRKNDGIAGQRHRQHLVVVRRKHDEFTVRNGRGRVR